MTNSRTSATCAVNFLPSESVFTKAQPASESDDAMMVFAVAMTVLCSESVPRASTKSTSSALLVFLFLVSAGGAGCES